MASRTNDNTLDLHIDGTIFAEQPRGGITRVWINLLRRYVASGRCRVTVYMPRGLTGVPELPASVKMVRYPPLLRVRPGRVFGRLAKRLHERGILRMWSGPTAGIFHSTHFTTYETIRLPQVLTIHDMFHETLTPCFEEREGRFRERKKRCAEYASAVICPSQSTLDDAKRIYGLDGVLTKVIPFAADPAFRPIEDEGELQFCRRELAQGHPFILYVGTRYPYKHFAGLLAAYASWPKRSVFRLVAIGGGPSHAEHALVRGFAIEGLVHFHPPLADVLLAGRHSAAAALVVPSLSEGFGLPVVEAMACRTPVVAARAGALPEVGGQTAVYFDHGPPTLLAEAMDEAIQIPRTGERIRKGAINAAKRSWDQVAGEHLEVYERISNARDKSEKTCRRRGY